MEECLGKLAKVRHIGVGSTGPARQNRSTIPPVPRIIDLSRFKFDFVGFL
jgi:hypothetical protein